MNTFAKKLSITMLTAATAFAPLAPTVASAGDGRGWHQQDRDMYRYKKHHGKRQGRNNNNNNDAIVLGIIGLGVGAIIGGAIANSHDNSRVIYRSEPRPRDYYPEAPRAASGGYGEPWTQSWFNYCEDQYRSFNASTGTYRGYDGKDHFCEVR